MDYDRAYYDHWYRDEGFGSPADLRRRAAFAIGAAEYVLGRPVRSVLDVGCGEGAWQPVLRRLRPRARYLGIDPSTYVVERFGRRRNLRVGEIGHLADVVSADEGPFDLVVCIGVIGYVADADVPRGLRAIADRLAGIALLEILTSVDDIEGDLDHYRRRTPARYRRWLTDAGLARIGPNLFAGAEVVATLSAFESPVEP